MSQILPNLLYTKTDEWVLLDGDIAIVGITDFAQEALSDIVFLELPAVGDTFGQDETFGALESVKAASDLHMPVSGEVVAVNEDLLSAYEKVNQDPYGAWMVKVRVANPAELKSLLNASAYEEQCANH